LVLPTPFFPENKTSRDQNYELKVSKRYETVKTWGFSETINTGMKVGLEIPIKNWFTISGEIS
jgi:hypothetical protein